MNWATLLAPVLELLLRRGGWIAGLGMIGWALCEVGVAILERSPVHILHTGGILFGVIGFASLFLRGRRNSDMLATGVAEIKEAIPGKTQPSADPAIQSAQLKLRDSRETGETPVPVR